jgi:hypothetical protein
MTKVYYVEIKLGAKWALQKSFTKQTDAMHYVKEHAGEKYPFRIIRSVRTVVFDGEK